MRWRLVVLLACCAAGGVAACGRASHPRTAGTQVRFTGPATIARAHVRAPSVDTTIDVEAVLDPATDLPVPVQPPRGTRTVAIVLGWRDAGRTPLPWGLLRFVLVDDHGRHVAEQFRLGPERIRYGKSSRLDARVLFAVRDGARAQRLDMRSVLAPGSLRARWALRGGGAAG